MQEQTTLFDNDIKAELIIEQMTKVLPEDFKNAGEIILKVNKDTVPYDSIMFSPAKTNSCFRPNYVPNGLICRIKTYGETKWVSFSPQFKQSVIDSGLSVFEINSDPFCRVQLNEFYDYSITNPEKFGNLISSIILNLFSFDRFDCCGKFKECSDAKKCLHEDKLYSTACTYRKKIEQGIFFFGKNRNV